MSIDKITGIILAGGKSSRIGSDKAFLKLGEKILLNNSIDILKNICDEIIISSNKPIKSKYQVVSDEIKEIGPLGGIVSSLRKSNNYLNVVLSCDLPFITTDIIKHLVKEHKGLITIPTINHINVEPLCAVYHMDTLSYFEIAAKNKNYKLHKIIESLPKKIIDLSNKHELFLNINNPGDYKKAEKIFKKLNR